MSEFSVRKLLDAHADDALELHARTINPQYVRMLRTIGYDRAWARAEGAHLYDAEGNRYLDWLGGFGMYNVGRNNPRVRAALVEALELDTPGKLALGVNPLAGLLAEALLERAPSGLGRVLFTSSGTEAVEAAIKIGRAATGRTRVALRRARLSRPDARRAVGLRRRRILRPLRSRSCRASRGSPGTTSTRSSESCAPATWRCSSSSRSSVTALFLPSPGYLEGAQALCRAHGTLFCVDEVQTGLGRTGRFLALEHWGLEPDIVTVAKSLSGGYVPVGATLFRPEVFDAVFDSMEHSMSHGSTFQPNDLAMVAGLATLHELDDAGLVERSARLGEQLLERTRPLVERYDVVKDVRGLGLMWAIELGEPEQLREDRVPAARADAARRSSPSSSSCRSSTSTAS